MAFRLATAFLQLEVRDQELDRGLNRARGNISAALTGLVAKAGRLGGIIGTIGATIVSLTGFKFIQMAADAETASIAFNVMIKDIGRTNELLKELNQFSQVTPFQPQQVREAAQLLLAFGNTADDIPDLVSMIGDAAAGSGQDLVELARIFGQVQAKGRLQGEENLQLVERMVNVGPELRKIFGVSREELAKMQERGEITFPIFLEAFRNLTKEGGQFFGAMEKQSKSFNGLMSTLTGKVGELGKKMGEKLLPAAKDFATLMIPVLDKMIELIDKMPTFPPIFSQMRAISLEIVILWQKFQLSILNAAADFRETFGLDKIPGFGGEGVRDQAREMAKRLAETQTELAELLKKIAGVPEDTAKAAKDAAKDIESRGIKLKFENVGFTDLINKFQQAMLQQSTDKQIAENTKMTNQHLMRIEKLLSSGANGDRESPLMASS